MFTFSTTLNVAIISINIQGILSSSGNGISKIYTLPDTLLELEIAASVPWTAEAFESFLDNQHIPKRNQTLLSSNSEDEIFNQVVYVDFNNPDSVEEPYIFGAICIEDGGSSFITSFPGVYIHTYTDNEKEAIMERMAADFGKFNVTFVQERPTSLEQEYSTLTFNALNLNGRPNLLLSSYCIGRNYTHFSGQVDALYGLADGIDFRNRIHRDNGGIDVNIVEVLAAVNLDIFRDYFDIPVNLNTSQALTQVLVKLSARIASHELGHILGLSHHDSFGAIGFGLPVTVAREDFFPTYIGQQNATEVLSHVMATGSVDRSFDNVRNDDFFSERSSLKLSFALNGDFVHLIQTEQDFQSKPDIEEIPRAWVPNTLMSGRNSGTEFLEMSATVIKGTITQEGEIDDYRFKFQSGQIFSAEVISFQNYSNEKQVITRLTLYREECDGSLIQMTNNSQAFEGFDPIILDEEIIESGIYVLRVDAPDVYYFRDSRGNYRPSKLSEFTNRKNFLIGEYELILYSLDDDQETRKLKEKRKKHKKKKKKHKGEGKNKSRGQGKGKCKVKRKGKVNSKGKSKENKEKNKG